MIIELHQFLCSCSTSYERFCSYCGGILYGRKTSDWQLKMCMQPNPCFKATWTFCANWYLMRSKAECNFPPLKIVDIYTGHQGQKWDGVSHIHFEVSLPWITMTDTCHLYMLQGPNISPTAWHPLGQAPVLFLDHMELLRCNVKLSFCCRFWAYESSAMLIW